ncbi:hypothetical protein Pst134EB_016613 [Puccinia striiformis f. sp. tritici]|nr:hypothetical protein Pst134EB_016613 [Puccinia striiformis f. sp. tritici]
MHDQIKTNIDNYNKIPDPLKTADEFGISGNKIQDMVGKRVNGHEYKWDRVLSFEGDTGPYLQCQDQQTALARLWLYRSCGDILANAMKLFTLDPLDHM